MTSEPVVGVVLGRPVVDKMTLIYICLHSHSPTLMYLIDEYSPNYLQCLDPSSCQS